MERSALMKLWPKNAHDIDGASALVAIGYPAVAPVMRDMVQWLKGQGPAMQVFAGFLGSLGGAAVPYVREALASKHELQTYNVITTVVAQWPADAVLEVAQELEALLTKGSVSGINVLALQQLARVGASTHAPIAEWKALFRTRLLDQLAILDSVNAE